MRFKRWQTIPRRRRVLIATLFLLVCSMLVFGGTWLWNQYVPSSVRAELPADAVEHPLFYHGQWLGEGAEGSGEAVAVSLDVIKKHLDPHIRYEAATQSVIITTKDRVVRFRSGQLTASVNERPFDLRFPVEEVTGPDGAKRILIPLSPLGPLYGLRYVQNEQTGAVLLDKEGDLLQWGTVLSTADPKLKLRRGPHLRQPYVDTLAGEESLLIWGESSGWYRVQKQNGRIGYAPKSEVRLERVERLEISAASDLRRADEFVPWKPLGGHVNLLWEHVHSRNPDVRDMPALPGVNVVSPTWFELQDGSGALLNRADSRYVKWAHKQGMQVWALFSNGFDPERTQQALADFETRQRMIRQLLTFAQLYQLQGINLDFENVYLRDKDRFVQFVRELTPLLHEQNLVVSLDVTFKSNSPQWSMFLDRPALLETVDYMAVMAYDEHWGSSPRAGSVASLPWVERGLKRLLDEDRLPPEKLLLGMPFYTRLWTETTTAGVLKVKSRALSMMTAENWWSERGLKPVYLPEVGQHYVEHEEDDVVYKMWLEDKTSIESRVKLARKYQLGGVASWRRGFEANDILPVIERTLTKRP